MMPKLRLSVVIPTLDEAGAVAGAIRSALAAGATEVIVADGGSRDGTTAIAAAAGARVVRAPRGRGPQLNSGAAVACGNALCFLHADGRLAPAAGASIRKILNDPSIIGGNFRPHFGRSAHGRFLAALYHVIRRLRIYYGDSAIFCRADAFRAVGGFPAYPLMEDLAFVHRLHRRGRMAYLQVPVFASPRRWQQGGDRAGVGVLAIYPVPLLSPHLAAAARPLVPADQVRNDASRPPLPKSDSRRRRGVKRPHLPTSTMPAVGVLTRAPQAGQSKTRLAAAIGAAAAAQLATAMLQDTTNALCGSGAWHTTLFAEPSAAAGTLGSLTGCDDVRPQSEGSIGARMLSAARALRREGYAPVVLVGSDIPGLMREHISEALEALREADVVFGPAWDGGCYLIGLWEAAAELFDDAAVPWSTSEVLAASEKVAAARGWSCRRIRPEQDVDSPADLATLRARLLASGEAPDATRTLTALAALDGFIEGPLNPSEGRRRSEARDVHT